jgi:hypothetical protein
MKLGVYNMAPEPMSVAYIRNPSHQFRVLELLYDWRFTAHQFVLATSPLMRVTTSNFIFQLNTCGYSPYVTSSLTRG